MESPATREIVIRPLRSSDVGRGFFELLSQLTKAPRIADSDFDAFVRRVDSNADQLVLIAERAGDDCAPLLGTASVLIEHKAIRGGSAVGHVEDVVVDEAARGARVGKRLIDRIVGFCRDRGCYKVILDCAEGNVPFYERCGFERKEVQMAHYF